LGAVIGHEAVHTTDEVEIMEDLEYEEKHNRQTRPTREDKPRETEQQIMLEYGNYWKQLLK